MPKRTIPQDGAVLFRSRLREARAAVLADAEGYVDLILSIEELGRFVTNDATARGQPSYVFSAEAATSG